ncbi:MAG TPA: YggT family protein [Bacilli bacterium]|nr:YggT family protein [Bacilli bacterium]HQD92344.1 YggT family protein [Bacilli bacterium]
MIIQKVLVILYYILFYYHYIMVAGVILTWIPSLYNYRLFQLIHYLSDGYLGYFRGKLVIGFIDFSPIVGFSLYFLLLEIYQIFLEKMI